MIRAVHHKTKRKPRFNFLKSRPNQNKVSVSFNLITKKTEKSMWFLFISENAQRRAVNSNSLDNRESRETFYFPHQLCIVLCRGCVCRYRCGGWYLIIAEILSLLEIFLLFIIRWRLFQLEKKLVDDEEEEEVHPAAARKEDWDFFFSVCCFGVWCRGLPPHPPPL